MNKIEQYINSKKEYKNQTVKIYDQEGNMKKVKVTVPRNAPLCNNAKDLLSSLFEGLPHIRD